jgi:hypothetical protein
MGTALLEGTQGNKFNCYHLEDSMNKRIQELAEQARDYADDTYKNFSNNSGWFELYNEKFAELIVRDCMEVASPNYMSTPEDSVYYVEQAIDRIAEHFGVEE